MPVVMDARIDLGADAQLVLALPDGMRKEPSEALPAFDVSTVPGAVVVARLGFTADGDLALRLACAKAPSRGYAPGVEQLVLARASVLARGAVPGLERWDEHPLVWRGDRCEQRLEGLALGPNGATVSARARDVFGFVGEPRDAVACSLVCTEPESSTRCDALISSARAEGFVSAPAPSFLVRGVLLGAAHPRGAGVAVAALGLAIAAWILARRPRPRR